MAVSTKTIETTDRGTSLLGYLAFDDAVTEPRPAVIVSHAWRGRSDFECDKAQTLARMGYVGFAADLYGGGHVGTSRRYDACIYESSSK